MLLLLCLVPILAGIVQYLSPFSVWTGTVSNITNSSIPSVQQNAGWDASRHRILTAMHGYSRYREKNLENTNRWRDFYKRIPKRQRSTIDAVLRPGGLWVNLGPLLYGTAPFLQLSLEEVLLLSESVGFELRNGKEEYGRVTVPGLKARTVEVLYGSNERGLSWNGYKGQFWIARRK